jgi:hypothetical protein
MVPSSDTALPNSDPAELIVPPERLSKSRKTTAQKRFVVKGEEIDRARIALRVRDAVIPRRADRQPQAVERDRTAEQVVRFQPADRDILAPAIARSDDRLEHRRAELRIAEREQIDRARIRLAIGRAIVEPRAHGEPVTVERDRRAEIVLFLQAIAEQRQAEKRCIVGAENADLPPVTELFVAEGEQVHRTGIGRLVPASVVIADADDQAVGRQRQAGQRIAILQTADRQVVAAQLRIIRADPADQLPAGKDIVGKGEQIDGTGIGERILAAVVQLREDRQATALKRKRVAEMVGRAEPANRDILGARILETDGGFQIGAVEGRIGEAEQIDRAMAETDIALAVVEDGSDGEPVAIERDRAAEIIVDIERKIDILAAGIALTDDRFERRRCKLRVGEAEQIHRACIVGAIGCPIIEQGPDREPVAIQRQGCPEQVARSEIGDVQTGWPRIARSQHARQLAAAKAGICKGEEIDRPGIGRRIADAIIVARRHRQTQSGERDGMAEKVASLQCTDRNVVAAAISGTDDGAQ